MEIPGPIRKGGSKMTKRQWYEIYGQGPAANGPELLAKLKSPGLAYAIAEYLKQWYTNVTIK